VDAGRQVAASNSNLARANQFRLNVIRANGQSLEDMKGLEVSCYELGHSEMRGFRNPDDKKDPVLQAYWQAHRAKHGEQASAAILNTNLHNVSIYPTTSAHPRFLQMRVITPLSVKQTAIDIQVLKWKGAPEELHHRNIQYANAVHSLSSMIKPDDLEAYQRIQEGLTSSGDISVSQHSKFTGGDSDAAPDSALSERYIRNQYRAWLEYMCGDAT
jgi:hypothetical protein